ncbi:MAG TPA: hypothetical protein VII83_08595, partial [Gaiellaceae bacterium]
MADDKVIQLTPSVSMELVEAAQSTKARAETGAVPVGLGDGFIVPSRFRCFIETDNVPGLEVGLRVVVADDGTPTCVEFMLRQTDEQEPTPITWETLRNISLAQLLKVAGGAA